MESGSGCLSPRPKASAASRPETNTRSRTPCPRALWKEARAESRGYLFFGIGGGVDRHRELGDVALGLGDFRSALLFHLVDADDRVHRQVGTPDVLELGLDPLLGWIDDDTGALAEDEFLDLDEAEQPAMADAAGVDLVDLALAHENDLVQCLVAHLVSPKGDTAARISPLSACRAYLVAEWPSQGPETPFSARLCELLGSVRASIDALFPLGHCMHGVFSVQRSDGTASFSHGGSIS